VTDLVADIRSARGLSEATASHLLATDGPNSVVTAPPPRLAYRILRQLTDPLVNTIVAYAIYQRSGWAPWGG